MTVHLAALSGSLRQRSFHTALLRAAAELLPPGATLELVDYRDVPLYDGDLPRPEAVDRLVAALGAADGVLIATPEYNHSVPGVLKNAIDWASRPAYQSVFAGRPAGVLSASPGSIGGARAQLHLENILLGMGAPVFPGPQVNVAFAGQRFDDALALAHEDTRRFLAGWLARFVGFVERNRLPAA